MHPMCSENHLHFDYARLAWDSGFCFEEGKNRKAFDISVLGLVDVDKVCRERDMVTVEKHLSTILQFRLDEELAKILEPTFVKVFKLSQLGIQYLQFCNKYLDNTVVLLKNDCAASIEEITELQSCVEELRSENENLKRTNIELRESAVNQLASSYKCNECTKVFSSEDYLKAHVLRRHDSQSSEMQAEAEKLQLEIKELKQRLNSTEKFIKEPNNDVVFEKEESVKEKFEELKNHIEKELGTLRDEAFYRKIYEKWFDEIKKSEKKVLIEQGAGDSIQIRESSTQTQFWDELEVDKDNKITEKDKQFSAEDKTEIEKEENIDNVKNAEVVNSHVEEKKPEVVYIKKPDSEKTDQEDAVDKERKFEILEERLKHEAEVQREKLESVLETKLAGSLERLENQMSTFWQKLGDFEKQRQAPPPPQIPKTRPKIDDFAFTKPQVPPKIVPRSNPTRYIRNETLMRSSGSESETSDESSREIPPPKTNPIMVVSRAVENVEQVVKPKASKNGKFEKIKMVGKPQIVASRNEIKKAKASLKRTGDVKQFGVDSEETSDGTDEKFAASSASESTDIYKKPNKTSTLGRRSIKSLENIAKDEEVVDGLKEELVQVLNLRLKELGVAPQWKGLPEKSYQRARSLIMHQFDMSKKNSPNYTKIRENIIKKLEKQIKSQKKERKSEVDNWTQKKSQMKKIEEKPQPKDEIKTFELSSEATTIDSQPEMKVVDKGDSPNKSALKPKLQQAAQWRDKKKVFFNLDSDESSTRDDAKLDAKMRKGDNKENQRKDDSDWDISDIAA